MIALESRRRAEAQMVLRHEVLSGGARIMDAMRNFMQKF